MSDPKRASNPLHSRDFLVLLGATLFFAFMLIAGVQWGIPKASGNLFALTSPAFYPYLVCGFGLVVSVLGMAAAAMHRTTSGVPEEPTYPAGKAFIRFLLILAVFALNYILLHRLGALVTSVLVFAGLLLLGGERRIAVIATASIGIPLAAYLIFSDLARVPLPAGIVSF